MSVGTRGAPWDRTALRIFRASIIGKTYFSSIAVQLVKHEPATVFTTVAIQIKTSDRVQMCNVFT